MVRQEVGDVNFQIDTGATPGIAMRNDRADLLLQVVQDQLPDDATQAQIDGQIIQAVTGELRQPKTAQTVRRRWCQLWPLIAPLAEREPEQFDALFLEFLDRIETVG